MSWSCCDEMFNDGRNEAEAEAAATISQLQAEIARLREASENDQKMIALLRADLAKFAEGGADAFCEGCNAPLLHDDDVSTVSDVQGCWGYVSDWKGPTPCYRYRTEKGVERSWPACAALGGSNDKG